MQRLQASNSVMVMSVSLAFLAGYVDALGFMHLGGIFVSFMSGNSTRLGIAGGSGSVEILLLAGVLVLFVSGVIAGTIAGRRAVHRARTVMAIVALLLVLAGISTLLAVDWLAVSCAALAMGVVNTLFEKDGEVSVALTYMTGTLVRMGQHIATALSGGPPFGWLRYLSLWMGLVSGAAVGAFFYALLGLLAIWMAALGAVIIFVVVTRTRDI